MRSRRQRILSLGVSGGPPPLWLGLLASPAAVALGTLIVVPLEEVAPVVSLSVVYLPGVMLISIASGWRLGVATAVASALAFNFSHLPPPGRLRFADERNWAARTSKS